MATPPARPLAPQQAAGEGKQPPLAQGAAALPGAMPEGCSAWWAINQLGPLLQERCGCSVAQVRAATAAGFCHWGRRCSVSAVQAGAERPASQFLLPNSNCCAPHVNAFALHFVDAPAEEQQGLYRLVAACLRAGDAAGAARWVDPCVRAAA